MQITDINLDRQFDYEYAEDRQSGATVLLLREGDRIFIGYDVPQPNGYVPEETRARMAAHEIPAGLSYGPHYAMEKLREYITRDWETRVKE